MKVTQIKSYSVADSEGRPYLIVKVETDEGIHGLGEIGIRFWGSAISSAIEHLSEIVIGEDPFSTERLWQHIFRGGFFPADKVYCCAISAIDIALWDIKGKAVGMPVYKLLGGPVRDKVVCYPHTQGRTTAELVESCKAAVDAGWKFVRWGQPETSGTSGVPQHFYYSYVLTYPPFLLPLPAPQVCFPSGNTRQSGQARRPLNFHAAAHHALKGPGPVVRMVDVLDSSHEQVTRLARASSPAVEQVWAFLVAPESH